MSKVSMGTQACAAREAEEAGRDVESRNKLLSPQRNKHVAASRTSVKHRQGSSTDQTYRASGIPGGLACSHSQWAKPRCWAMFAKIDSQLFSCSGRTINPYAAAVSRHKSDQGCKAAQQHKVSIVTKFNCLQHLVFGSVVRTVFSYPTSLQAPKGPGMDSAGNVASAEDKASPYGNSSDSTPLGSRVKSGNLTNFSTPIECVSMIEAVENAALHIGDDTPGMSLVVLCLQLQSNSAPLHPYIMCSNCTCCHPFLHINIFVESMLWCVVLTCSFIHTGSSAMHAESKVCIPPNLHSWLQRTGLQGMVNTPVRQDLQQLWTAADEARHLKRQVDNMREAELDLATKEADEMARNFGMLVSWLDPQRASRISSMSEH